MTQEHQPLTDIGFVKAFDHAIGEQYENAKNRYQSSSIEALVILRGLVASLCNMIAEEFQLRLPDGQELSAQIESLRQARVVNPSVIDLMHKVRINGNKGAHPDVDSFDRVSFRATARTAATDFCCLIEQLNSSLGNQCSRYEFVDEEQSFDMEVAYKAAFLNDAEAKHHLGKALIFEGQDRLHQNNFDDGYMSRGVRWIKEATEHRVPEALFDMGLIKLSKMFGEPDPLRAIDYMMHASYQDHAIAKGLFGSLVFEHGETELYDEALRFLLESADGDSDPLSLLTLAKLHLEGQHVPLDEAKSMAYLDRSLEQEYIPAIYMKAQLHLKGNKVDEAIELYEKCSAAGDYEASLALARLYQTVELNDPQCALEHYECVLKTASQDTPEYAFSLYQTESIRFSLGPKDLDSHLKLLEVMRAAYQLKGCDEDTQKEIEADSPKLIAQYRTLLREQKPTDLKYTLVLLAGYNEKGLPYKDMFEGREAFLDADNARRRTEQIYGVTPNSRLPPVTEETKTLKDVEKTESRIKQKQKNRKANKSRRQQRRRTR